MHPIRTIIEIHAEEAAFRWLMRRNATRQPHYSLGDLEKLDSLVEGHIDGLRIAAETGWEVAKDAVALEGPGELFTASMLAFESGQSSRIDFVLGAAGESYELSCGITSALGWLPYEQAGLHIDKLIRDKSAIHRRIGTAAAAIHRQNPGQPLRDALAHQDPQLRGRALRAVGELGLVSLLPELGKNLTADDELCRFSAAWAAALIAVNTNAAAVLKSIAESDSSHREEAIQIALRRMELGASIPWQKQMAKDPNKMRLAIQAAGIIGDPVNIPWLIDRMNEDSLARVAGESFSMITGVDIANEDLEGEWPEGFEAGPTEEPEDENVEMDPDEDLPWPDPDPVRKWWGENQSRFKNSTRYLLGRPISEDSLAEVLKNGYQRQRRAAALELAIRKPGQPLFEVRAPGFRQIKALGL